MLLFLFLIVSVFLFDVEDEKNSWNRVINKRGFKLAKTIVFQLWIEQCGWNYLQIGSVSSYFALILRTTYPFSWTGQSNMALDIYFLKQACVFIWANGQYFRPKGYYLYPIGLIYQAETIFKIQHGPRAVTSFETIEINLNVRTAKHERKTLTESSPSVM